MIAFLLMEHGASAIQSSLGRELTDVPCRVASGTSNWNLQCTGGGNVEKGSQRCPGCFGALLASQAFCFHDVASQNIPEPTTGILTAKIYRYLFPLFPVDVFAVRLRKPSMLQCFQCEARMPFNALYKFNLFEWTLDRLISIVLIPVVNHDPTERRGQQMNPIKLCNSLTTYLHSLPFVDRMC